MSRQKTIEELKLAMGTFPGMAPVIALGRSYDAGYLEGSGQSSITALEREVIVAALEWMCTHTREMDQKLWEATYALSEALEKAETE